MAVPFFEFTSVIWNLVLGLCSGPGKIPKHLVLAFWHPKVLQFRDLMDLYTYVRTLSNYGEGDCHFKEYTHYQKDMYDLPVVKKETP